MNVVRAGEVAHGFSQFHAKPNGSPIMLPLMIYFSLQLLSLARLVILRQVNGLRCWAILYPSTDGINSPIRLISSLALSSAVMLRLIRSRSAFKPKLSATVDSFRLPGTADEFYQGNVMVFGLVKPAVFSQCSLFNHLQVARFTA